MAVGTGPSPWNYDAYQNWREGFRAVNKRNAAAKGVEHSLSSGWRAVQPDDWEGHGPKKPKMKTVTLYNGKVVQVPDADYADFIGHHTADGSDADTEIGKYIDEAQWTQQCSGKGHITELQYSPRRQLMSVTFAAGDEVIFFRVPKEVYSELKMLAESEGGRKDANGVFRHILGIRFWDIVRIRGTVHGVRYKAEYVTKSERHPRTYDKDTGTIASAREPATDAEKIEQLDSVFKRKANTGSIPLTVQMAYKRAATVEEKKAVLKKAGIV